MINYKAAAEELACHEEEISAEAMGLKIGSATPTMGAARLIIEAALGDEPLYRRERSIMVTHTKGKFVQVWPKTADEE